MTSKHQLLLSQKVQEFEELQVCSMVNVSLLPQELVHTQELK